MNSSDILAPEEARWHHLETAEVTRMLGSHPREGLDDFEAKKRLQSFGPNVVSAKGGVPPWKRFLEQFHQPLVYILLAACVVTAFLNEWVDSSVIFGVVLIKAIIGYIQ